MMDNKFFRWIVFAVAVILAILAIFSNTFSGFLCFAVVAFVFIPINKLFEKLDTEFDPKYRKRATIITVIIFTVCGLLAFTTAGNDSEKQSDKEMTTTGTTITTTTTANITEPAMTTTLPTTTTTTTISTTAAETTFTTTIIETTITTTVVETKPEIVETMPQGVVTPKTETPVVNYNGSTVIITENGSKYHKKVHGDWNVIEEIPRSEAEARGYEPCKICY